MQTELQKPAFQRYETTLGATYEILNSTGKHYYTVEMMGGYAVGCECKAGQFGKRCGHKKTAEKAEQEWQREQKSLARNGQEAKGTLGPQDGHAFYR